MRKWLQISLLTHLIILGGILWQSWMHVEGAIKGCSSSGAMTCDVMFTPYGYWFSIPTPFIALGFYVMSLAVAVYTWRAKEEEKKEWVSVVVGFSWIGLLTALYFGFISVVVLRKFCPYCAIFYVGAIILFMASRKLKTLSQSKFERSHIFKLSVHPQVLGAMAVSVLVVLLLISLAKPKSSQLVGAPQVILGSEARSLGPVSARFQIVEFSDFQCPHCKKMGSILKQLEREEVGSVRVTYKFYPLDPQCNSKMPPPGHALSCNAAVAALCAANQGKFWVYHDLLFANQEQLSEPLWKDFASQAGLDLPSFESCIASSEAQKVIKQDIEEGDKLNVEATPTLFVNGQKFEGDRSLEGIKAFLKSL